MKETEIFICSECKNIYSNKTTLILHILTIHQDKPAVIKLKKRCKKKTCNVKRKDAALMNKVSSKALKKFTQSKVRKYKTEYSCDVCFYKTVHMSTYKRHLLVHEKGSRIHKCKFCSYSAIQPYNLQRHIKQVHPFGEVNPVFLQINVDAT